MNATKHPLKSKTIRFNLVINLIAAALLAAEPWLHLLSDKMPVWAFLPVVMVVAAINKWLRFLTDEGISFDVDR